MNVTASKGTDRADMVTASKGDLPLDFSLPNVATPVQRIRPTSGLPALGLKELWAYRELLYFFIWRDIKVRYKQTALGAAWAIIQPVSTMIVFSLFFGKLGKIPSDGLPYPIFCYTALAPWMFFVNGLNISSSSLVTNAKLLTKIYFPRLAVPISAVLSGIVDFAIAFSMLLVLMAYYQIKPGLNILWMPLFLLLALVTSLGAGIWLSALNVKYRDVRYVVPFLTQFWLFATPVAYPSRLLSEPWRTIYGINPMVGVVEGFRWSVLGSGQAPGLIIIVSSLTAVLILLTGVLYFRRMEDTFADII